MNFLKSKIIFAIIFCVFIYCIYEWSHNKGIQLAADDIKIILDEIYKLYKTDVNYIDFLKAYDYGTAARKSAKQYDILFCVISAIYIIYFLKTNLK